MIKTNSVVTFLRTIYYDEFKWSVVKSIGVFTLGVRIAQECAGMELLPEMPHFRLETNVPQNKIPSDFSQRLCGVLAKSLGKPINYCVATVIGGVNMSWGGSTAPAAQAVLMSIGGLGVAENKKHSKALFEMVSKELNIPPDRMYITFTNAATSDVGYNGSTFHDIFG